MNDIMLYTPLIGFFCFILAAVFIFVWPKSLAKEIQTLTFPKYVLHYFHPLAWVLGGMGAFMYVKYAGMATVMIGLGVLAFGVFIYIMLRSS